MNENVLGKRPLLIPAVIAALILFGALIQWPYGYYQLLRFIVSGISIFLAFISYRWQKLWAAWLFGFIAILFNPLIPIPLPKYVWHTIDVTCAFLFVAIASILKKPTENKAKEA